MTYEPNAKCPKCGSREAAFDPSDGGMWCPRDGFFNPYEEAEARQAERDNAAYEAHLAATENMVYFNPESAHRG